MFNWLRKSSIQIQRIIKRQEEETEQDKEQAEQQTRRIITITVEDKWTELKAQNETNNPIVCALSDLIM